MRLDNARNLLSFHEGRRNVLYKDSLGYWTFGVGHLCDPAKGATFCDAAIDAQLDYDIAQAQKVLPSWTNDLNDVRHMVLLDMAFNLGNRLLGFKKMLAAVQEGRYADAAKEMLDSTWAKQVGTRATRLARMMETGEWPVV